MPPKISDRSGNEAVIPDVKGKSVIEFDDEETAARIGRSLMVDDDEFCTTRVEGSSVVGEFRAADIDGIRRAADDWMACLMAAVKE